MSPYRESASSLVVMSGVPRGLIRANGSNCTCKPPSLFWCWWFGVKPHDQWLCEHGGAWERQWDVPWNEWHAVPPSSTEGDSKR